VWELRSPEGGETRRAPWIGSLDVVVAWSADGSRAFVSDLIAPGFRVFRVDLSTGRREPWLETAPPDPTGIGRINENVSLTPDGRYYAYSYRRQLNDLFLVEGLH